MKITLIIKLFNQKRFHNNLNKIFFSKIQNKIIKNSKVHDLIITIAVPQLSSDENDQNEQLMSLIKILQKQKTKIKKKELICSNKINRIIISKITKGKYKINQSK